MELDLTNQNLKSSILGGAITASLSVLFYLTWSFLPLPDGINMVLHFFFGVVLIMAFVGIYATFNTVNGNYILKAAAIFGILAGAMFMLMTVVQRSNLDTLYQNYLDATGDEKTLQGNILKAVFSVQLGIDVCWDICITVATILLGIVLLRYNKIIKLIGVIGIAVASLTLFLNLYTFPTPPSQAGLFDAGPFVGSWYIFICILLFRAYKTNKI